MPKPPINYEATRFKPGQSGNPKGRPKKLPAINRLLLEVLGNEEEANSVAKKILNAMARKAKTGDKQAADFLFERAYGKVSQPTEVDTEVTIVIKRDS